MHKDSVSYTMAVAAGVCVACSLVVSTAAVTLRPIQRRNAELAMKRNILLAAGLKEPGQRVDVESLFEQIETRVVDLRSGRFTEEVELDPLDDDALIDDPERATPLPPGQDIAGIGRRPDYQTVYLLEVNGELDRLILPVHGRGLWAMMHGLIALDRDMNTIQRLIFYEHGETPGLGGEVDSSWWRDQWIGKQAFDDEGRVRIEVIKGEVDPQAPGADHKVDGISGATFTARGVSNLVRFWLGELGYGPFLENMRGKLGEPLSPAEGANEP